MANSGQNFLDLLFGGVDKGINQFRQQQGQQTDLALTIQQMLQRQKQAEQGQANVDRNFNADEAWRKAQIDQRHGEMTARRMEGGAEQFNAGMAQKLALHQREVKQQKLADFAKRYPQFAPAIELMGMGAPAGLVSGAAPDAAAPGGVPKPDRAALSSLLGNALRDPTSFVSVDKKAYKKLSAAEKSWLQPVFASGSSEIIYYKGLAPHMRGQIQQWRQGLEGLGGVLQGPVKPPEQDETDEQIINDLYGGF